MLKQFEAAREAKGPVRDHRPLCINLDDHTRVCHIQKAKRANFRSLQGVVTHADGKKHSSPCDCQCGKHVSKTAVHDGIGLGFKRRMNMPCMRAPK